MSQIFHPVFNTIAKAMIFGGLVAIILAALAFGMFARSPYATQVQVHKEQPVPFSHKHHVEALGIDCRYCHTSVENSAYAGIPPVSICMNCHSQIWTNAEMLEPVRESFKTGKPVDWVRIHDLPDFVYFDHSIHVQKGISCKTCHGDVDQMPLMRRKNNLHMEWCLGCHKNPEKYVGLKDEVYNMTWEAPEGWAEKQKELVKDYHINKMTDCTTCHR